MWEAIDLASGHHHSKFLVAHSQDTVDAERPSHPVSRVLV